MPDPVSRRLFLTLTGATLLAPPFSFGDDDAPALLDHILLGFRDLDEGISFVEENAGVRAAIGGVHPGRGTRNALLSLGERRYLEIIAPDPHQSGAPDTLGLYQLTQPRLVGWAAHPGDLDAFAKKLREAGVALKAPRPVRAPAPMEKSSTGKPSTSPTLITVCSPSSSNGAPIPRILPPTPRKAAPSIISRS